MEIRVEETLTGRALRAKILATYGSRQALELAATKKGGQEAAEELAMLRLLEAEPRRLADTVRTTMVSALDPKDLARLTPQRVRLLQHLASRKEPVNLSQLVKQLKRDKKHLSQDLRVLEELGFLAINTEGRSLRPQILGNEIHITVVEAN